MERRLEAYFARKVAVAALLLLLWPALAFAQTTISTQLGWDVDAPPADVATYATVVTVNGQAVAQPPTCTAKGAGTTCVVPVANFNQTGANTVNITNTRGDMTASVTITGLTAATMPKTPSKPRLNVTVTINVQ